ncbi:MAG: TetR/AcrR family transcriptional regulator [Pseudomonas sp.]
MTNSADSPANLKTRPTREGKPPYHHGNLREALIEGGLALLEEYGAAELSQRLLARQLGVSQTAPYHHFGDKNALLAALATEGFRRSANVLKSATIEKQSLERRVRGLCAGYVRFAREKPELFRLMYGTAVQRKNEYPELVAASTEAFEALATKVAEMITDFDITHVDARQATTSLLGLSHGLAHLVVDRRVSPILSELIDDERVVVEHAARLFVKGFQPSAE